MLTLSPIEARVLGVLVEKAQTTPAQYPLSLNALTTGCNQKNNRDPVVNYSDDDVIDALDGLREKQLIREALLAGSRVTKYRHIARETLGVSTAELIVLTDLMLRGPQAPGELRSNASRMMPPGDEALASLESTVSLLEALGSRPEPLVRRLPQRPGERAARYEQLVSPNAHPLDTPMSAHAHAPAPMSSASSTGTGESTRLDALEAEVASLKARIEELERRTLGL